MKKPILFFAITLILFSQLRAQVYHPFPDSNARWSEERYYYHTIPYTNEHYYNHFGYIYQLGADTVINSKEYTLVGGQDVWWDFNVPGQDTYTNYPYQAPGTIFGCIREDSSKHIWFISFTDYPPIYEDYYHPYFWTWPIDSEILLYDFNLQVGDHLTYPLSRTVLDIDSIKLGDSLYHKRIVFLNGYIKDNWVEGMGSNLGLFGPFQPAKAHNANYSTWLNCFTLNGQSLYEYPDPGLGITCDSLDIHLLLDVPDVVADSLSSNIFPNPFTTATTLQFNLTTNSLTSLQIYNAEGKEVKTILSSELLTAGSHSIIIDLGNYLPGMYYYMLSCGDKTEVGKMVLMK